MNTKLEELEEYYKKTDFKNKDLNQLESKALAHKENSNMPSLSVKDIEEIKKKVIIKGIKKDLILGVLRYYIQTDRLFPELKLHPETKSLLEKINYGIEYNLPIEKEVLYKALPNMFGREIRKLNSELQHRFLQPKTEIAVINNPRLKNKHAHAISNRLPNDIKLKKKIFLMTMYHLDQCQEFFEFYNDYLLERSKAFNYPNAMSYFEDLMIMDEDKLSEVEKKIVSEANSLIKIDADIHALEIRSREVIPDDLDETPFPFTDAKYREEYLRDRKYFVKFGFHDWSSVFFYIAVLIK